MVNARAPIVKPNIAIFTVHKPDFSKTWLRRIENSLVGQPAETGTGTEPNGAVHIHTGNAVRAAVERNRSRGYRQGNALAIGTQSLQFRLIGPAQQNPTVVHRCHFIDAARALMSNT